MLSRVTAAVAAVACMATFTPVARGAAADCEPATIVAAAEADAWVDANSASANKGSDATLNVGETTRALIRVRVPAVPEGCVVEAAHLRLHADSGTDGARVEVAPLTAAWAETAVTWDSQPPAGAASAVAWSRDGYMRWDVRTMLAGPHHGFVVRDVAGGTEGAGGHGFYAREKGENPPQLVIRFAPPRTGDPAPPAPPVPARVECGQRITQSTLLTGDLIDCDGDGLVIGAPHLIVDLGGHVVDGVGLGTGVRNEGYAGVTVRNGSVREFDRGVELLEETTGNVVERLYVHDNEVAGVELFAAEHNVVRENAVEHNGGGIVLASGTRATSVRGNALTMNSGPGVLLRDADDNDVAGNRIAGGGDLGIGLERSTGNVLADNAVADTSDGGIELSAGSHDNRVEGSRVAGAGDTGIMVSESDRTVLTGNTASGMSDSGITLDVAHDGLVRGNRVGGNPGGLQIDGSTGNRVEGNDASGGSGIGIELGGGSFGNTLTGNTTNANGADGIFVADEAILEPGNVLQGNTASFNAGDGMSVAKGGHTLLGNVASGNRGWGVIAGGLIVSAGNIATGNGQAGQCSGLLCGVLDLDPPDTTVDDGPDERSSERDAVFAFAADEPLVTFACALDGAAFTACTSPQAYASLEDGEHVFQVRAADAAGNVGKPVTLRWTIDTAPPETTLDGAGGRFAFASDEDGTFECALDDAEWAPCASPVSFDGLEAGVYVVRVRAVDAAGNADPTPAEATWTVAAPPDTAIASGPDARTAATHATFTFSADREAGFECGLDAAAFAPCTSPLVLTALADGEHALRVRAVDADGHADPSPAIHRWTVDTTAPQTTITSGPPPLTSASGAEVVFAASEPGATFECALDGAAWTACTSPLDLADLTVGAHEVRVRATDALGNVDSTPAVHAWTVEPVPACTPSTVTLRAAADTWVLESSPTSNHRTDSSLKLAAKSRANARVLVQFALAAVPAGCRLTSARLRLYAASHKSGRTLTATRLASAWTEAGATWRNQPAPAGPAAATRSGRGWLEWTVTDQVQAMYGGGAHGFVLADAAEGGGGTEQVFNSREKTRDNPPQLVLAFG